MAPLLTFLGQSWVGSVIGLCGIIIGAIVAYIFYRRSLTGANLVFKKRSMRLIDAANSLPQGVIVLFEGSPVKRLTKNYFVLWNSGHATLLSNSIITTDPFRLELPSGSTFLQVNVLRMTRAANEVRITIDQSSPNRALLSFDYLNPNDGAVLEVLHTGEQRYAEFKGELRGMTQGVRDLGISFDFVDAIAYGMPSSPKSMKTRRKVFARVLFAYSLAMIGAGIWFWNTRIDDFFPAWTSAALLVVLGLLLLLALVSSRQRYPKTLAIDELRE